MEYCSCVWAVSYLLLGRMLDNLKKWICSTVGLSLAAFHETWTHCQNVASLSLFYRYYFGTCSSELARLVSRMLQGCLCQQFLVHITNIITNISPVLYRHSSLPTTSRCKKVKKGKVFFKYMYENKNTEIPNSNNA